MARRAAFPRAAVVFAALAALLAVPAAGARSAEGSASPYRFTFDSRGWHGTIKVGWNQRHVVEGTLYGFPYRTTRDVTLTAEAVVVQDGTAAWTGSYALAEVTVQTMSCLEDMRVNMRTEIVEVNEQGTFSRSLADSVAVGVENGKFRVSFRVGSFTVTRTERRSSPDCADYRPSTKTETREEGIAGLPDTVAGPLESAEVPRVAGSASGSLPDGVNWTAQVELEGCGELAGAQWPKRYPGDNRLAALEEPFRSNVRAFYNALLNAGATVNVIQVYRPQPRAYLMHYAWRIAKGRASGRMATIDAVNVPKYDGPEPVPICWMHRDWIGRYDKPASIAAAQAMVDKYGIHEHGAAYPTNHSKRMAIDWKITWPHNKSLKIRWGPRRPRAQLRNRTLLISSFPHSGMNRELWAVGRSYGVIKYNGTVPDPPHWSATGN